MSCRKWNLLGMVSEEHATMKFVVLAVPIFLLAIYGSAMYPNVCGWGLFVECMVSPPPPSPPPPSPSNSPSEITLHPYDEIQVSNVSLSSLAYLNESSEAHPRQELSNLEKNEICLAQARTAIREARNGNRTQDSDYVPTGPVYWNAKAFHRSYLEMEKHFKIFVYEVEEPPFFPSRPCKSKYFLENNFIHNIEMNNYFRIKDPEKAHVFFLHSEEINSEASSRMIKNVFNVIAAMYPYWNRSLGADHFILACHDWDSKTSLSLHNNSIRVLSNANTSEGFKPAKDVSFPEINLKTNSLKDLIGGSSASKRSILAFFAGRVHGPIRPILLELWENKDEDIQVHKNLQEDLFSYYEMMRKSKFCLCPSGYEVSSPILVEAIYTGCVPVLISEHYVPPLSDVLNWKSFSVELSVKDIPNLKNILMSISPREYIRMQRRVEQIGRHFEVNSPPKRFDVFHMILHSVWIRRLNIKVHEDQGIQSQS